MDALRQDELVRGDILRLGAHHPADNRLRVEEEVGEAAPAGQVMHLRGAGRIMVVSSGKSMSVVEMT